jgi:serine/threonine protein kinase
VSEKDTGDIFDAWTKEAEAGLSKQHSGLNQVLPTKFGRYVLVRRLAAGGMGEVYLGLMQSLGFFRKLVAIKCLHRHLSDDERFVEMFLDEARLAAQLTHAQIVQTFDVGEVDGTYYIAMEYIHGATLTKMLEHGVPPIDVAANVALGAVAGLAAAHGAKDEHGKPMSVVHRDVSPRNILVSFTGEVKLTDFGIARAATQTRVTQTGEVKGTLNYMPLEQLDGLATDPRSDVYAMGVSLFELFAGQRPFDLSTLKGRDLFSEEYRQPKKASLVNPRLSAEIDGILMKATAVEAKERYADGKELLDALRTYVAGLAIIPQPEGVASWLAENFASEAERPPLSKAELAVAEACTVEGADSEDVGGAPLPAVKDQIHPAATSPTLVVSDADRLPELGQAATMTAMPQDLEAALGAERPKSAKSTMVLGIAALFAIGAALVYFLSFRQANDEASPTYHGDRVASLGQPGERKAAAAISVDAGLSPDQSVALKVKTRSHSDGGIVPVGRPPRATVAVVADAGIQSPRPVNRAAKRPAKISLRIVTIPAGANVLVDGKQVGKSPLSIRRTRNPQKKVQIFLTKKGFGQAHRNVALSRNRTVIVKLKAAARPEYKGLPRM